MKNFFIGFFAVFALTFLAIANPLDNSVITPGISDSADAIAITISSDEEVTMGFQPCFLAFNSATDNDVTGAGTIATIDFDTEVFDQGNDFAADTFTAPVTGRYLLTAVVQLLGIPTGADLSLIQITTSNRAYRGSRFDLVADFPGVIGHTITVVADMDICDTATVTVNVDGATDVVDIEGQGTNLVTSFSGCLIS